jgi:hypothetical protein
MQTFDSTTTYNGMVQSMLNAAAQRNHAFAGDFMTILHSQLSVAHDVADKAREFASDSWRADAEEVYEKLTDLLVLVERVRP